ncbi:MAG: C-type cytochrome biosis protein CcmI [Rhodocyclales bacterium]|nr:C-type cytochrome biosis protein CcmI [Rhodocyclales bacterium]
MTAFLIAAAVLVLAVTGTLLWPLIRRAAETAATESPALKILREQRKDLETERAAGKIEEASYVQTLGEIERRALEESVAPEATVTTKPRLAWAIAVGIALPATAIGLYLIIGNPAGLNPANAVARQEQQVTPQQIDAMVARLAERVQKNPDDIQGMQMLGRSYMVLNRFGEAAKVFALLAEKQPHDAQVFADWADAAASAQDRKLDGDPERLIAKALAIDPKNVKALALSGTIAFDRKDYKRAIKQWQEIATIVPAESEFGQSVQAMITEARKRGGIAGGAPQVASASEAAPASASAPAALALKGQVTLAAALKSQVGKDDSLFIFARPAAGGRPLAGMRFKASELPVNFDFSKAQMMMGSIGPQDKVIIGARISKSGNPLPAAGDLQGFSEQVLGTASKALHIEISEQVK